MMLGAVLLALLTCLTGGAAGASQAAKPPASTPLAKVQALSLESVKDGNTVVYYSKGREARGRTVLALVRGLLAWCTPVYGPLDLKVAVLNESDWKSAIENPYGVPGVRNPGPIAFMPADVERGTLYREVLALTDSLPSATKQDIAAKCGSLSACTLQFADLIVLHEIAHMYVERTSFGRPNMWLGELVPDYLVYAYLRGEHRPELAAWSVMNAVTARMPPHVTSLANLERERHDANSLARLEPELPRLHGILMERIPEVYEHSGLDFVPRLAKAFPRQAHPKGCWTDGLNEGICRSQELSEEEVLRRLDVIAPGFSAWSQRYGTAR